jgi:two-component system OmpR family response regulator
VATRIVVVDAEPTVREIVACIIETDGYEVTQTDDPRVVVELIKEAPPALIITNVALRGMSGYDAMRIFKQHAPGVPVLMIPGLPDAGVIQEWGREPGFEIFPKPFNAADLRAKVREMLGRR